MRHKNTNWNLPAENSWQVVNAALLMDIRDELGEIRKALAPLQHLNCHNFLRIPAKLDRIGRNTEKLKR